MRQLVGVVLTAGLAIPWWALRALPVSYPGYKTAESLWMLGRIPRRMFLARARFFAGTLVPAVLAFCWAWMGLVGLFGMPSSRTALMVRISPVPLASLILGAWLVILAARSVLPRPRVT